MSLKTAGVIEIPGAAGSAFDHGTFDTKSRRVFIAHTKRSTIEVIDPDAGRHITTLPGFPGAAGAVADDGKSSSQIAVRRASLGWTPLRSGPGLCSRPLHGRTVRPSSGACRLGSRPASATTTRAPHCRRSVSTMASAYSSTCPAGRAGA